MTLNIKRTRDLLQELDFKTLFNELGWSLPKNPMPVAMVIQNSAYTRREIAELSGVAIFEIEAPDGKIPDAKMRKAIHQEISPLHLENLLIFLDEARSQSLWYRVEQDGGKPYPREHLYVKGQPGDLFLGKLQAMVFDIEDFDESGNAPGVLEVARRLKEALDVERLRLPMAKAEGVLIGSPAVAFAFGITASQFRAISGGPSTGRALCSCGTCTITMQASPSTARDIRPAYLSWVFVQRLASLTSCTSRGTWQLVR